MLSTHSPTAPRGEGGGTSHQRGIAFLRPQGDCMVFAAKGGIEMAPKAPYLPSGTVLHISRGRSPQPVREASAGPGQNPWRPGPEARRRHQPSRRSRVNLREYWKAPPRSRSRSRPRRKASEPSFKNSARHLTASGQRLCITSRISLRRLLFPLLLWFFPLS